MKKRSLLAMGVLAICTSIVCGATLDYSENFESWDWDVLVPSAVADVNSTSKYWYTDANVQAFGGVAWGGSPYGRWMYFNNSSTTGNAYKNFLLDGTLAVGESFTNPTVSAWMQNVSGGDSDPYLKSRIQVLDAAGNGYMGLIGRAGNMELYSVTAGVTSLLAQNDPAPDGNGKTLTLSVIDGVVTLGMYYPADPSTVYSISANSTTYNKFTTIAFGAEYFWGEAFGLDNISLSSTIVPEPATLSILLGMGGMAVLRRRNRK